MKDNLALSYDDVSIVPTVTSIILHRSYCDVHTKEGILPIFAAPMTSVVNERNIPLFIESQIMPVIPRCVELDNGRLSNKLEDRCHIAFCNDCFMAVSMDETFLIADDKVELSYCDVHNIKLCIDVANGHMFFVLEAIKTIKSKYPNTIIMAGNIANPETYLEYEKAGCDYVRVGIGGGSACLTASNTGVFYPYFTLLENMYKLKKKVNGHCKIIADGNIRGYRDIQKALLFADYVMIGGLFNKAIESAGLTTYGDFYFNLFGKKRKNYLKTWLFSGKPVKKLTGKIINDWKKGKFDLWKDFYGMSTKIAQKNNGSLVLKTSEGLHKKQKVEYRLSDWVENEISYLRSAMSYTNSMNLEDYKGKEYVLANNIRYNN